MGVYHLHMQTYVHCMDLELYFIQTFKFMWKKSRFVGLHNDIEPQKLSMFFLGGGRQA